MFGVLRRHSCCCCKWENFAVIRDALRLFCAKQVHHSVVSDEPYPYSIQDPSCWSANIWRMSVRGPSPFCTHQYSRCDADGPPPPWKLNLGSEANVGLWKFWLCGTPYWKRNSGSGAKVKFWCLPLPWKWNLCSGAKLDTKTSFWHGGPPPPRNGAKVEPPKNFSLTPRPLPRMKVKHKLWRKGWTSKNNGRVRLDLGSRLRIWIGMFYVCLHCYRLVFFSCQKLSQHWFWEFIRTHCDLRRKAMFEVRRASTLDRIGTASVFMLEFCLTGRCELWHLLGITRPLQIWMSR